MLGDLCRHLGSRAEAWDAWRTWRVDIRAASGDALSVGKSTDGKKRERREPRKEAHLRAKS